MVLDSLYILYEYGISLNNIRLLQREGLIFDDLNLENKKIQQLSVRKPALVSKVMQIISEIPDAEVKDNLSQLLGEGISENIVKKLKKLQFSYQDLDKITFEEFNAYYNTNKLSLYKKIKSAFLAIEQKKGRVSFYQIEKEIRGILDLLAFGETIKLETLEKSISLNSSEEKVEIILNKLIQDNYIERNENDIGRHYPVLNDYLVSDFAGKEIFVKRLQGVSSAKLSQQYNYSRQGIINIEKRVLQRMPLFREDLMYAGKFKNFSLNKELFCKMFNVNEIIYNYLNLKYKKGEKLVIEDLYNGEYTERQRRIILRYSGYFINQDGELTELSKLNIFREVFRKYATNFVKDEDMIGKFNEYIIKNNLPLSYISDANSIRGLSNRVTNAIRGKGNTYRYYDFEMISEDVIKELLLLVDLETGIYNMKKLYIENNMLMTEIDIRTEFELHNLFKQVIKVKNIKYNRMPEFTVGNINKNDFLEGLFREYAPVDLTCFLEFVEENWGLRTDSTRSYIFANLHKYIDGNVIKTDYIDLSDKKLEKLSNLLTGSLYTVEQMIAVGKQVTADFGNQFINNMTLSKINYTLRNNYILHNKYSSLDCYFRKLLLANDYFYNEHLPIYRSQTFGHVLYNLEKTYEIFKVEKDIYITYKRLAQSNITKLDIMNYIEGVIAFVGRNEYFTLDSIRKQGFTHHIYKWGFDPIFYERIIWTSDEIRTIQTSSGYIFKITNELFSLKDFLYDIVLSKRVIDIYDLIQQTKEVYSIKVEEYKVLYLLKDTDIYYSKEMHKFYADKEDYYEEVYENDRN